MAKPNFIVGIGASAGGLSALEQFFDGMPLESGMAFVVVQHLSPDFKSLMDNLLARHTQMPIFRVENELEISANSVYLIPPKKLMTISGEKLYLHEREISQHLEMPIDVFFHSLAEDAGSRAIGIILSGTGSDGSHGIVDIHETGGQVFVQSIDTAQFDGMPRSAIATGICDYILPPDEIAQTLFQLQADPQALQNLNGATQGIALLQGDYGVIFALLRRNYGIDFSKYKSTTVGRRIIRRMELCGLAQLSDYTHVLASDPVELDNLYQDLLIGVTEFFRDPNVFATIQKDIIPQFFKRAGEEGIRVWVAGCASGEEAYSLAILLHEQAQLHDFTGKISIFATDAHRVSLEKASAGIYDIDRLANVSSERLARYFVVEGPNRFRVNAELRKLVVFAHQNLIQDPPFTRMDLVSCRNLMIYLQVETQNKVLALLNFALKLDGILFLGSSEGLGKQSDNFDAINSSFRLYKKTHDSKIQFDFNTPAPDVQRIAGGITRRTSTRTTVTVERDILQDYDNLLKKSLPPGVLVDEAGQVLHYFPGVNAFLKPLEGRAETDILHMVEGDLQLAINLGMQRATKAGGAVTVPNIRARYYEQQTLMDLAVEYLPETKHYHISFVRHQSPAAQTTPLPVVGLPQDFEADSALRGRIMDLELELQAAKENLQATVEELQTSNEELQATNEELLAANEELQSTNEELHSVNEELYTVNAEFDKKNRELIQLNQDHENLLASIDAGTVFLDENLCIRKFNPASADSFKLLPQDIGRPINHIAYHLTDIYDLSSDVISVLQDGKIITREVRTQNNRWLMKRVLPFRTELGEIKGVVLTFTDISYQKEAERNIYALNQQLESKVLDRTRELAMANERLQELIREREAALAELSESEEKFRTLYETMTQGVVYQAADGQIIASNPAAEEILGLSSQSMVQRSSLNPEWQATREDGSIYPGDQHPAMIALATGKEVRGVIMSVYNHRDQERRWIQVHARPLFEPGQSQPHQVYAIFEDITARKQAEERIRSSLQEKEMLLREVHHRVKNNLQIISSLLGLQTNYVQDPQTLALFEDSRERVHSMALVHEKLYRSADLARIQYQDYLIELCGYLLQMTARGQNVALEINAEGILLGVDIAVPCSLLVNELVTNALKYGFPDGQSGAIEVLLTQQDSGYKLIVADNGIGLPAGFDWQNSETFGLRLVGLLVNQLDGTIEVRSRQESADDRKGVQFEINFPADRS